MSGYGTYIIRDTATGTIIRPPRRPRPRLCAVCHEPASFAEVETVERTSIDLDARVSRSLGTRSRFYCDKHHGAQA